jgi:protein tyrosine phosphatase (PTP) superfamily phosphohydrolase (DUF442 family)
MVQISESTKIPPTRRVLVAAALLVLVGGSAFVVWRLFIETYHFAVVQENVLYRDGNRGLREFRTALRHARPKTVVCLVSDFELADPGVPQFQEEVDLLEREGIAFEHIPIDSGGWPSDADVKRFLAILADPSRHPVLVHCAQGVRRTGMMVAAYQEAMLGYRDEEAKAAALAFGHSIRSMGDVYRFIELFVPGKPFPGP